jgi:chorismate dehydratase
LRAAIVSYLNAQPLVRALGTLPDVQLVPAIPSRLPELLESGAVDLALLPVAALPRIPGAHIACDWGIAADGPVASVALFADVPLHEVEEVVLDWQSCTSVALVRLLLRDHWRLPGVRVVAAEPGYIDTLGGGRAGVIIGDRALASLGRFNHHWDLADAWQAHTGLPFVFAAWAAVRPLPAGFAGRFAAAHAGWATHVDAIAAEHPQVPYDLHTYFHHNLRFALDARMHLGLTRFLAGLATLAPLPQAAVAA